MRFLQLAFVVAAAGFTCGHLLSEPPQSAEEKFRRAVVKDGVAFNTSATETATDTSQAILFPSYDPKFTPPQGSTPFRLSQEYPSTYDPDEAFPWAKLDFRADHGEAYLRAVLAYCLKGNVEVDFRGQDNKTRTWYHAPWMHDDSEDREAGKRQGREYHHGLTRERRSRTKELHPLQTTDRIQNWAVSMYNPRGGYTIGRVWRTPDGFPAPSQATFPDNTVSFKLLFSAAPVAEVPFLKGSFEWTANINPAVPPKTGAPFARVDQVMRLLQVDVAVKDPRVASGSGWVFGTFVYDGSRPGKTPWEQLVPVGVSWGDDSSERSKLAQEGSFVNPKLTESLLNPALIEPTDTNTWKDRAYLRHHGLGGRLNGPVDNPSSSCISCHGRAGTYAAALPLNDRSGLPMPILAGTDADTGSKKAQIEGFGQFFRLVRANSHLENADVPSAGPQTFVTVDYSLQLSQGIRNFYQALRLDPARLKMLAGPQKSAGAAEFAPALTSRLPRVSRGGDDD